MIYSKSSLEKLETCHHNLKLLFEVVLSLKIMDVTIIEGYRGEKKQNEYYYANPPKSKVKFPNGKHNKLPSMAVDAAPFISPDISWDKLHCCVLAGIVLTVAKLLRIKIRWGGNWDMDYEPITDQDFQDLVHYELVE